MIKKTLPRHIIDVEASHIILSVSFLPCDSLILEPFHLSPLSIAPIPTPHGQFLIELLRSSILLTLGKAQTSLALHSLTRRIPNS